MFGYGRRASIILLIGLPVFALSLNALSWLRYGLDLPFLDDWAEYYFQSATSLSFSHLFAQGNDTIYPVGRFLDVMSQKFLNGNGIAYQFISMVLVLGLLLFLQWRLLRETIDDPLTRAAAFGLCVFMICPYSYWGLQNIAYVQALPTICILLILHLMVSPSNGTVWHFLAIGVVGIVSGLSYISGAFVVLAMGIALFMLMVINPSLRGRSFIGYGIALLLTGAATTAIQFGDIILHQGGRLHRADAHWVMPYEPDYWLFLLGKIGRAMSLQNLPANVSLLIVLSFALSAATIFLYCVIKLGRARGLDTSDTKLAFVYYVTFSSVFVYLNMLAASRAKLRPETVVASLDVFKFGFENRFHFFWATLLFPWVAAVIYSWMASNMRARVSAAAAATASFVCIALAYQGGVFGYGAEYAGLSAERSKEVQCLQDKISAGKPIVCPALFPFDMSKAFVYARSIGASFTRYFPYTSYAEADGRSPPLFKLMEARSAITPENTTMRQNPSGDFEFTAGVDSQAHILVPPTTKLESCLVLRLTALVRAPAPDIAQLFYKTPGDVYFSGGKSQTRSLEVSANDFTRLVFTIDSLNGFLNQFRLDVVQDSQPFSIRDIDIRCLIGR